MGAVSLWTRLLALCLCTGPKKSTPHPGCQYRQLQLVAAATQRRPPPQNCTCGPTRPGRRGSHTTARELRAHFRAPALQNTTKIPREDPPERHRNSETVAGKGRKSAKFWAHPFGAPPFRGPTQVRSHFGSSHFSQTTHCFRVC